MVDEPEKTADQKNNERKGEVSAALAEFYKEHKVSDEQKKRLRARLEQIFDQRSEKPVTAADLKTTLGDIFTATLGKSPSVEVGAERRTALLALTPISTAMEASRGTLSDEVDKIFNAVAAEGEFPGFATVQKAKKLQVMADLQANIPAILNSKELDSPEAKKKALVTSITKSLSIATEDSLRDNLPQTAETMATKIMETDDKMRTDMEKIFAELGMSDGEVRETKVVAKETGLLKEQIGGLAFKTISAIKPPLEDDEKKEAITQLQDEMMSALGDLGDADAVLDDDDDIKAIQSLIKGRNSSLAPAVITKMATDAVKLRNASRTQISVTLEAPDAGDTAKKDKIMEEATARLWPEMLRQDVPDAEKLENVKAVIADSVSKGGADLSDEDKQKLDKVAEKMKSLVDAHHSAKSVDQKFIAQSIANAPGGSGQLIPGVNMGMPTMAAAGGAAVVGLATEMSTWKKVALGSALIGGALAYENWDAVSKATGLPGGTPAGAKKDNKSTLLS